MRYFLDTEFIDNGQTIDLISIGIVCEDGRELYVQSCEFNTQHASPWVKSHVIPNLAYCETGKENHSEQCSEVGCPWRSRLQIRDEVKRFLAADNAIELWGWCSGYDYVVLCQLFGTMMDCPVNLPHYIRDIQQVLDERGIVDEDLPQQSVVAHNALEDARYVKQLWEYLV